MRLFKILLGGLVLVPVLIALLWWWLLYTQSGAQFLFSRAASALDGGLAATSLDGAIAKGLRADGVQVQAGGTTVTISGPALRANLDLFPVSVTLSGVNVAEVRVSLARGDDDGEAFDLDALLNSLRLPVRLVVTDVQAGRVAVYRETKEIFRITDVEVTGSWDHQVRIESVAASFGGTTITGSADLDLAGEHALSAEIEIDMDDSVTAELASLTAGISLSGFPENWRASIRGVADTVSAGRLDFDGTGTGDLEHIVLDSVAFQGDRLRAAGTGMAGWADGISVAADLDVEHANLHALNRNWPESHPVHGQVSFLYANRRLEIRPSGLSAKDTDMRLEADGVVDLEAGNLQADLHWVGLEWPVGSGEPRVASPNGSVVLSGHLDDWAVAGKLSLVSASLEDGRFAIDGGGDRESVALRITEGNVLGGQLSGDVAARWAGEQAWRVDLQVDNVRPGTLWPRYQGTFNGRIVAEGQVRPLTFDARFSDVRGNLGDYRLSADGSLSYSEQVLAARNFTVRHGDTRLTLDGDVQANGLRFSATTQRLEDYLPQVAGDLDASGRLSIRDGVETLQVTASSDRLEIGGQTFTGNRIMLESHDLEQDIDLETRYRDMALVGRLNGRLGAVETPFHWRGQIESLELANGDEGSLELVAPATVSASIEQLQVEALCLSGPRDGKACGSLDWQTGVTMALDATVDDVPLAHLNRFYETGLRFDQRMSGEARWEIPAGSEARGRIDMQLSPGTVRANVEEGLAVRTGPGRAAMDIDANRDIHGHLDLPLPGTGVLNGDFSVEGFRDAASSRLDGELRIDVSDLAFVRVLLPAIDDARGELLANIALGGTLQRPHATGEIVLENGAVDYRPLGLRLSDMSVTTTFDADRYFELEGSFRAGDGMARLSSRGDYAALTDSGFEIHIDGKGLELINVPDVKATADTDLLLGFRDGRLTVNGEVNVPYARLSAQSLPATRRTESSDVVIVAGDLPDESEGEDDSPLRIDGELGVTLGDDVLVELDVAEASITGSTRFTWRDELIPEANGRFEIAGQVQAYGQVLDITEGTVRFPKVPADNPKLRIRAEREIFGNSQIKRAGVLVDGTAKRPTVEVYTDPRTTEERALTLLVTGSDFDMEQGVGAIDFGTYIAPRLFVSYGVGLFDRENVISARYDLGKGFGIKATSGQKESGVDLIYRIEK